MGRPKFNLLIAESPLTVLPTLAVRIGLNEAILAQQLHYWTQRTKPEAEGWVYKTREDWLEELPWLALRTLTRVITHLREAGVVEIKQLSGQNRTNFYRLNYAHEALAIDGEQLHSSGTDRPVGEADVATSTGQSGPLIDRAETTQRPQQRRASGENLDPILAGVMRHLGDVADAKRGKKLDEEAVVRACADFGDRDLVLEAGKFAHWWLHGDGATRSLRDVVRAWRNWLSRAKRAAAAPRTRDGATPGEHPADRRAREIRERHERRQGGEAA